MSTFINLEILHNLPLSNANRDDAGQPKTVSIGGTTRGRISSQSLKRAARFYGADKSNGYGFSGDKEGGSFYRTKLIKKLILEELEKRNATEEQKNNVDKLFGGKSPLGSLVKDDPAGKGGTLVLITKEEVAKLADVVQENNTDEKTIVNILKNSNKKDIALWGRFFASSSEATLDGSAQVAHAFTTHTVALEEDFFTGLDDATPLFTQVGGAGHTGEHYYLTGTFYKYANINIEETIFNLINGYIENNKLITSEQSNEQIEETLSNVISTFLNTFVLSVPQGMIRSTAHQTLPSYVRVTIRKDRPVNAATAYDQAIRKTENITQKSIQLLEEEHVALEQLVGVPEKTFILDLTNKENSNISNLQELINGVNENVKPLVHKTLDSFKGE